MNNTSVPLSERPKFHPKMVALRLYPDELTQLQHLARAESRTVAAMARVLMVQGWAHYTQQQAGHS